MGGHIQPTFFVFDGVKVEVIVNAMRRTSQGCAGYYEVIIRGKSFDVCGVWDKAGGSDPSYTKEMVRRKAQTIINRYESSIILYSGKYLDISAEEIAECLAEMAEQETKHGDQKE